MATAYERIRQRKIIYLVAIVVLLGLAYAHKSQIIDTAAKQYDISETNLGKVDLGGSISRFVLSSFRGPLVCGLWWEVTELQERHDYKQLEILLTALTKLQPHFKKPWQYQGWNLAYNVSVEFDRVQDKYFYISKGIRWLANGEEINRIKLYDPTRPDELHVIGDPEMRSEIAQYISGKMYYADEQTIFRPLLHMSCIPPSQREPVTLKNNPSQLERFKQQYPRFVRRVRSYLNVPEGDEVALNRELINFLTEHQDVPSLWQVDNDNNIKLANDPWPRWPNMADRDLLGKVIDQELMQDGLDIAGHWFEFSTEMLPPPKTELSEDVTPQQSKYTRTNKSMHSMIFRAKPAQTQSRSAQELYKEGWAELGQQVAEKGHTMWLDLGKACNIEQPEALFNEMSRKAKLYQEKYREQSDNLMPPPEYLKSENPQEYAQAQELFKAYNFINNLVKLRTLCRYDYWKQTSLANKSDTYREASLSRYFAEQNYTDWPVSVMHYQRAIGLLSLLFRNHMKVEDEIALRCSMLAPGISTTLAQVTPATSFTLSLYGSHDTIQEEMLDLQEKYMRTIARNLAPDRLRAEYHVWLLRQHLSTGLLTASCPNTVSSWSGVIAPEFLNIDWIEDVVSSERGPFDDLIPEALKANREKDKTLIKK